MTQANIENNIYIILQLYKIYTINFFHAILFNNILLTLNFKYNEIINIPTCECNNYSSFPTKYAHQQVTKS